MTPVSTALTDMIRARDYDAVRAALAENPALLEQPDEEQDRPLHVAAQEGDLRMATLLLDLGAEVNGEGLWSHTPLFWAARSGNRELCDFLRQRGGTANLDVNVNMQVWHTPLSEALVEGDIERARLLLDLGASPDVAGRSGTPLYMMFGWVTGDVDVPGDMESDLLGRDNEKRAAHLDRMRAVFQLLLERGADPDGATNGSLVVDAARYARHFEVSEFIREIGLLLDHGADINATESGCFTVDCRIRMDAEEWFSDYEPAGVTALHIAAHFGILPLAQLLLERGADPNYQTGDGETPLHFLFFHHAPNLAGTWEDRQTIFEALLASGADINARDDMGRTPLHWVAGAFLDTDLDSSSRPFPRSEYDNVLAQALDLFASQGANFWAKDNNGLTPQDLVSLPGVSALALATVWRRYAQEALTATITDDAVQEAKTQIENIGARIGNGGLTADDIHLLIGFADQASQSAIRQSAATGLVAIARQECRLNSDNLETAQSALHWVARSVAQPAPELRHILATAFGDWEQDYLISTAADPMAENDPNENGYTDWLQILLTEMTRHQPRVVVLVITLLSHDYGWEEYTSSEISNGDLCLADLVHTISAFDADGARVFLRLIEEAASSLPNEEQISRDFICWPQSALLARCALAFALYDWDHTLEIVAKIENENLTSDALCAIIPVIEAMGSRGELTVDVAAKRLRSLLPMCARAVARSEESYTGEADSDYWSNHSLYEVLEGETPLWLAAAVMARLQPDSAMEAWEEAILVLDTKSINPDLKKYQIEKLCQNWTYTVASTVPEPALATKTLLPLVAQRAYTVDETEYKPFYPRVVFDLLAEQGEPDPTSILHAAGYLHRYEGDENNIPAYITECFGLWARLDKKAFTEFVKNTLRKKDSTRYAEATLKEISDFFDGLDVSLWSFEQLDDSVRYAVITESNGEIYDESLIPFVSEAGALQYYSGREAALRAFAEVVVQEAIEMAKQQGFL